MTGSPSAPPRRRLTSRLLALLLLPAIAPLARRAAAQPEPQVVKLVAKRFRYTPEEVRVKAGVPVALEFTALDFEHGFSVPDLKLRADLVPGRVTTVRLPALAPGRYDFLCDNFCGDEHEDMHGRIIAVAADA